MFKSDIDRPTSRLEDVRAPGRRIGRFAEGAQQLRDRLPAHAWHDLTPRPPNSSDPRCNTAHARGTSIMTWQRLQPVRLLLGGHTLKPVPKLSSNLSEVVNFAFAPNPLSSLPSRRCRERLIGMIDPDTSFFLEPCSVLRGMWQIRFSPVPHFQSITVGAAYQFRPHAAFNHVLSSFDDRCDRD